MTFDTTLFGPVVGAMTFLLLEEVLSQFRPGIFPRVESLITEHWLAVIGLFIIFIVLTAKQGIYGYFGRSRK